VPPKERRVRTLAADKTTISGRANAKPDSARKPEQAYVALQPKGKWPG
jgi:hypothetical protein